ncbi:MAG: FliH/SctL family protein [Betaproteobacteria bacterium]
MSNTSSADTSSSSVKSEMYSEQGNRHHEEPKKLSEINFAPEKIKKILENSFREGYDRGLKEGYAAGMELSKQELAVDKSRIKQISQSFKDSLDRKNETICEDVLELSLDIAKVILKTELKINEQALLEIIKQAIDLLPNLKPPLQIILNPHDAVIIKKHMTEDLKEQGWIIVENAQIDKGGCLLETDSNSIDMTLSTRWKILNEFLGKDSGGVLTQGESGL